MDQVYVMFYRPTDLDDLYAVFHGPYISAQVTDYVVNVTASPNRSHRVIAFIRDPSGSDTKFNILRGNTEWLYECCFIGAMDDCFRVLIDARKNDPSMTGRLTTFTKAPQPLSHITSKDS